MGILQLAAWAVGIAIRAPDKILSVKPYCDNVRGKLSIKEDWRVGNKRRNISRPKPMILKFLIQM
ncbi:hypothetical protein Psyaliredsea_14050 [Psychrobacter alimentarius]